MLAANGIHLARNGVSLLAGAALHIAPGEAVALIGPNGAGKSTLLHMLSGATRADSGDVHLDNISLGAWSPVALARRRAVLPQTPELGFPLRVHEVVALGRSPHAGTENASADPVAIRQALEACDIAHLAERAYTRLSGGERQRVQLARILAQIGGDDPTQGAPARYLLLDEPTNNLDIAHQQHIAAIAKRFSRRGHGVLAVLHDPNLAAQYADRIVVLVDGRVYANGSPEKVITAEVMQSAFGVHVRCCNHPDSGRPYMLPI